MSLDKSASVELELVASGLQFPEGPVWLKDGSILLVEIARQTVSRVFPDGRVEVVAEVGGGPSGLAIGPDGALYICNNGGLQFHKADGLTFAGDRAEDYSGGSIQRLDLETGELRVLYSACEGRRLNGPNDIVFDDRGGFWFTDMGQSYDGVRDKGALYYAHAEGDFIMCRGEQIPTPNGIGLSPDGSVLYVADSICGRLWACEIAEPGVLAPPSDPWMAGRVLITLPGFQIFDSLAVEADGRVCVATIVNGGITTVSLDGSIAFTPVPDRVTTNICFGGVDLRDVWITAASTGKLYRCRWARAGLSLNYVAETVGGMGLN